MSMKNTVGKYGMLLTMAAALSGYLPKNPIDSYEEKYKEEILKVCEYLHLTVEELYERCKTDKKLLSRGANHLLEKTVKMRKNKQL